MRKRVFRDESTEVISENYVDLASACVRANQTGFFSLAQRVNAESYDSSSRDINPDDVFLGGRKIDLALGAEHAADFATKSGDNKSADSVQADPGSSEKTEEV